MKYHVNPNTGQAGICRATNKCPFGDESKHFENKLLAQKEFEKKKELF